MPSSTSRCPCRPWADRGGLSGASAVVFHPQTGLMRCRPSAIRRNTPTRGVSSKPPWRHQGASIGKSPQSLLLHRVAGRGGRFARRAPPRASSHSGDSARSPGKSRGRRLAQGDAGHCISGQGVVSGRSVRGFRGSGPGGMGESGEDSRIRATRPRFMSFLVADRWPRQQHRASMSRKDTGDPMTRDAEFGWGKPLRELHETVAMPR